MLLALIIGLASLQATESNSSLRFYTYDGPAFRWLYDCPRPQLEAWSSFKHGDDYFFAKAALSNHPWRTFNPDEASIFIVPILLAFGLRHPQGCQGVPFEGMLAATKAALSNSSYFQRHNGTDHLLVASDWEVSQQGVGHGVCIAHY
jgi:hypothetical protein